MLSATLQEGLERYSIGEKLRLLRLKRKMGLVELGRHTGLSAALLSKIERGKLFPTLPTLLRIALVFSVGLEHFFVDEARRPVVVVRARDRKRFPEKQDTREVAYHFECLDFPAIDKKLNAYYAEFHPLSLAKVRQHKHDGIELIYVLRGQLGFYIRGQEHRLAAGDAIYFDATLPHAYRRLGRQPCAALVVTASSP